MKYYKYVAIILAFRNKEDLKPCIMSLRKHIPNIKIVIVNSFFDEESNSCIKRIAAQLNCDFLVVENKGYGAGNNVGIDYARKNYIFDYLIVSNPDIVIQQFDEKQVNLHGITAPDITTISGKKQNPLLPWDTHYIYYFVYQGYKHNYKYFSVFGYAVNRLLREIFLLWGRYINTSCNIYAAHGSFFIISHDELLKLIPLYDEQIFLFFEELILAKRAKNLKIYTRFTPKIKILHKEDGSIKLSTLSLNKEYAKSNIYYYEHYVKGK